MMTLIFNLNKNIYLVMDNHMKCDIFKFILRITLSFCLLSIES